MIPIELGNGKTIMLKLEDWLSMTDEGFQDLIAKNEGYEIDDPFDSIVDKIRDNSPDWKLKTMIDEIAPELPNELTSEEVRQIENGTKKQSLD